MNNVVSGQMTDDTGVEHVEKRTTSDGTVSTCACGAHWSHPASRSEREMDSIFQSHAKHFLKRTETQ